MGLKTSGSFLSCHGSLHLQEHRKGFFKGGGALLNVIFQKGSFCTDLYPNTVQIYKICLPPQTKKAGGGGEGHLTLPPPPLSYAPALLIQ